MSADITWRDCPLSWVLEAMVVVMVIAAILGVAIVVGISLLDSLW
jgi:hypothetical protein